MLYGEMDYQKLSRFSSKLGNLAALISSYLGQALGRT